MIYPDTYVYVQAIRQVYFAYMLYCFFIYVENYLKAEYNPLDEIMSKCRPVKHFILCRIYYTIKVNMN